MARAKEKLLTLEEKLEQALVPVEEQPYEVPENWCWTRISYLCSLKNGRAFKPTDWSEVGVPIVRIQNLNDPCSKYNYFDGPIDETHRLYGGELLFAWSGTPGTSFGAHVWQGKDAVLNQHIFRVDFDEDIVQKPYFKYAINQRLNDLISAAHGGAGLQHVTKGVFESTPIVLAPLAEQHRIVDRIERLFAELDEAEERAQAVIDSYEDRCASILHRAFTGELTEEWRQSQHISFDSWIVKPLCDLCDRIFDGPFGSNLKSDDYVDKGIRVVRLENLKNLWFDDSKKSFVTEEKYSSISGHTVYPTDLIMSTFIADEIKICQMPEYIGYAVNKADCIGIRVSDAADKLFVLYFLSSKQTFNHLFNQLHGATRPRVNTKQIKAIPVPLPTLAEQAEIVRILDSLLSKESAAKSLAERAIAQIDATKQSILARAFRGELGTNDPEDEPAIELLKRTLEETK